MPKRGAKPGFKRGRHRLPYWIASQVVRNSFGFPEPCIALPPQATEDELATLCRGHTARLLAFIEQRKSADDADDIKTPTRYDGSMLAACRIYQEHPYSRFRTVKSNTRSTYLDSLKIIETSVPRRQIAKLNVLDLQHWYNEWRKPAILVQPDGSEVPGPERIDRAYDAIAMVKTVLRFNAAIGRVECGKLIDKLEKAGSLVTFEAGGGREGEMTFAYATAFARKALELGDAGTIPLERARCLAIGVVAQFELVLRQKDIIGERPRTDADLQKAVLRGATALVAGDQTWVGYFTWENIDGFRWSMKTSKSKYKKAANFDLSIYSLLYPLLQAVPLAERTGAIVKGEHDLPIQERSYRKWFREIARLAGIPDGVWNMDARAGGATEAEDAGADFAAIRNLLTHSERQEQTTVRYLRRQDRSRLDAQKAREDHRKAKGGGDGS